MPACPKCGQENPDIARFCLACGAELAPEPVEAREVRMTVTVVFTDVTGSTSLGERLDPESLRRVMTRYFDAMREVLERHGGTVEKFIGDAVMAVFGIPQLHEDDALRAVRAAADMRTALEELNGELKRDWGVRIASRTGVNTGPVVAGDPSAGQALVTGDAVNVAARLEQAAQPGEILIGEPTYRLTRDAVTTEVVEPLALKGKSDAVAAYRLAAVTPGVEGVARRLDSPLVGRRGELLLLRQALDRVERERGCHLFTILGPAGIGKTRLVEEFLAGLGEKASLVRGRCLPYGEGITYWPVAEAVRDAAGITEADSPEDARTKIDGLVEGEPEASRIGARVASVLGLTEHAGTPEETPWAVRKLLESMARSGPLVVVIDDAHWAEPALLDLVEHVADWTRDAPILLFCLARQELLDHRPGWGGGKVNSTSILLEPLSLEETERLIENLLSEAAVDAASKRRIAGASEGNPLFVEQLVAMLIDEGTLRRDNGRWVPATDLSQFSVPPTIQALLSARLDRLGAEERQVMERASVIGRVFYPGAVTELSPDPLRPQVSGHLMTLTRKELIRPDRSTFGGEEAFRFRHLFVRDAAYEAMPKELRADLHERFADWLERVAGDRASEYEEILGYHLEQAYRYRAELGPIDDEGRRLASAAAEHLLTSGRRAQSLGDITGTVNLLRRALELLPAEDPRRSEVLIEMAHGMSETGEYSSALRALDEAAATAIAVGDRGTEAAARLDAAFYRLNSEGAPQNEFVQEAESAIGIFTELGDDRRLARALFLDAIVLFWVGRSGDSMEPLSRALEMARSTGDVRQTDEIFAWHNVTVVFGHRDVEEGVRQNQELFRDAEGKQARAFLTGTLSFAEATRGNFDEAHRLRTEANAMLEDIGMTVHLAAKHLDAEVYRHEGDWERMVEELVPGIEILERMGERGFMATTSAQLADALYNLGRYEDAERYIEKTRAGAAEDDVDPQIGWRSVQAKILAQRGEFEGAERLVREAVERAEGTDYHASRGNAQLALAEVLKIAGRTDEAIAAARAAEERYELKGDRVLTDRARAFAAELGA